MELVWQRASDNTNWWNRTLDVLKAIDHDDMGNVYTTGYLHDNDLVFNGDTIENVQQGFFYYSQVFVLKYDAEGNEIYARTFGGNLNDVGTSILVTGNDAFFIGGTYQSNSFIVNGIQLQNVGTLDSFIVHAITPVYFRKTLGVLAKFSANVSSVPHTSIPSFVCYPNPAQSLVHFSDEIFYQVFDLYGRQLLNGRGNFVNIEALSPGTYLLIANEKQVIRVLKN
ncbi:MAG: T9SS type A sorting domain-containing protein [Saprospiraceae bacterium]|nr:T9SS type A sorting domain-containing protein [Saprospiraceae bacterium]